MKILAVFAAEFAADGKSLDQETMARCLGALVHFKQNPDSVILLAAGQNSQYLSRSGAELMKDFLTTHGIPPENIFVCGMMPNTVGEIAAMENFIRRGPVQKEEEEKVYAISSWYHLPRITLIWRQKHGRRHLRLAPVWMFSGYILKRAALEPVKILLALTNISSRRREQISRWFRKIGLI